MPYAMTECDAKVVTWGAWIDYYRATIRAANVTDDARWDIPMKCLSAARKRFGLVLDIQPWRWLGYAGERIETIAYGEGGQGYLVQGSGGAADNLFNEQIPVDSVARIDLAVTVWFDRDCGYLVGDSYGDALRWRDTQHIGRPYKLRYIDGAGDGDTLYVGQRGGAGRFVRVYDKMRESKEEEYRNAIRWECELSDRYADEAAGYLAREGNTQGNVAGLVSSILSRYGIAIPAVGLENATSISSPPREAATAERRLEWLKRQVRPAIASMIADGVKRETVLAALGLKD